MLIETKCCSICQNWKRLTNLKFGYCQLQKIESVVEEENYIITQKTNLCDKFELTENAEICYYVKDGANIRKRIIYIPVDRPNGHTANYGRIIDKETKKRMAEGQRKRFQNPVERKKMRIISKNYWSKPENRELVSKKQKERHQTPEALLKREEARQRLIIAKVERKLKKEKLIAETGYILTEEQRQAISERKFKPVFQYSLTGEFIKEHKAIKYANIALGLHEKHTTISLVLTGRCNTCMGYRWFYNKADAEKADFTIKEGKKSSLTPIQVQEIKDLSNKLTIKEIAQKYNTSQTTVFKIKHDKYNNK